MTSNLTGFLKRLVLCITAPVWILLACIMLVVMFVLTILVGFFQWLFTGKRTILDELEKPTIV